MAIKQIDASLTETEKREMIEKLLDKISSSRKPSKAFVFARKYFKYAAILLLMLVMSIFYNKKISKENDLLVKEINRMSLDSLTNTQLVFETGKQISINNKN